jgi:hypothetical protein
VLQKLLRRAKALDAKSPETQKPGNGGAKGGVIVYDDNERRLGVSLRKDKTTGLQLHLG